MDNRIVRNRSVMSSSDRETQDKERKRQLHSNLPFLSLLVGSSLPLAIYTELVLYCIESCVSRAK